MLACSQSSHTVSTTTILSEPLYPKITSAEVRPCTARPICPASGPASQCTRTQRAQTLGFRRVEMCLGHRAPVSCQPVLQQMGHTDSLLHPTNHCQVEGESGNHGPWSSGCTFTVSKDLHSSGRALPVPAAPLNYYLGTIYPLGRAKPY